MYRITKRWTEYDNTLDFFPRTETREICLCDTREAERIISEISKVIPLKIKEDTEQTTIYVAPDNDTEFWVTSVSKVCTDDGVIELMTNNAWITQL